MMRPSRVFVSIVIGPLLLAGCGVFHGPPKDRSRFVSAGLAGQDLVVFSYAHLVYRPAQGIAAFPDGGTAKYVVDRNIVGTFNRATGKLKILKREKNRDWQHDQGHFHITTLNASVAFVTQGGQAKDLTQSLTRYWLARLPDGPMTELTPREELARHGRAIGEIYLIDNDGTLLFICDSLQNDARGIDWRNVNTVVPELWIRTPGNEYVRVAASRHYERTENGEIIYWIPETRAFKAFSLATRQTRDLPNYRPPGYQDVTTGVSIPSDGQRLEYGRKVNDQWGYEPIPLTPEMVR